MPVTWKRGSEQFTELHSHAANRSNSQAWAGPGEGSQQQASLSSLLVQRPAGPSSKQSFTSPESKINRTPERVTRSQPASPARTRRVSSDRASGQYAVRSSNPAAAGSGGSFSASNTSSSSRNQAGAWNRSYGSRPASNPSPSRAGNSGHVSSGPVRSATPGRVPAVGCPQPAWGHAGGGASAAQQSPQLGDLFTAQGLKVPQRMAHSPYLNTARVQANSTVLQSPYSPKGRSNSIGPQSHTPQQQQQFTTSGSGLLAAAATDIARAKLSYAFSFQNSAAQGGAKVSPNAPVPVPEPCSSPEPVVRSSRGPGALAAHSPHSPPTQSSNGAEAARSSAFRSSRYTGAAGADTGVAGSSSSTRLRTTPAFSSSSGNNSVSSFALNAHKQSSRQLQQQVQQQQQRQQRPQQAWGEVQGATEQHHQVSSGQSSGVSALGTSGSSSSTVRPTTARGGSRAELRSEVTPPNSGAGAQPLGGNLDPHSWSTFLSVNSDVASAPKAAAATAATLGLPHAAGSETAAVGHTQQHQPLTSSQHMSSGVLRSGSIQSQMLADLGLGDLPMSSVAATCNSGNSAAGMGGSAAGVSHSPGYSRLLSRQGSGSYSNTAAAGGGDTAGNGPHRQASGSMTASAGQSPAAASNNSGSNGLTPTRVSLNSSAVNAPASKSILYTAPASLGNHAAPPVHTLDPNDTASGHVISRRSFEGSSAEGATGEAVASLGVSRAPSPALAAVAGPLHAGLLRPRSGQNLLHLMTQQQQQQQQQQQPSPQRVQQPASTQQQSYLSSLQQQQQSQAQQQQQHQQQITTGTSGLVSSQQSVDPRHSSSPAALFVQTPSGLIRRKSALDMQSQHTAVITSPSSSIDAAATISPGSVEQQQQQQAAHSSPGQRPGTTGDHSGDGSPYRRPPEVSASGSPLTKLQSDQWGTLTAMSAGSGFGTGASGFDSELSTAGSTGSWSGGGALLNAAAAAAATAVGLRTPSGPGPSPLSSSSTAGGTPGSSGHTSAGGGFASWGGSVRRALNFADGAVGPAAGGSGGGTAAIIGAGAVDAAGDAARHRLSNSNRSDSVTSQSQQQLQQQLRTPSKDGNAAQHQSQASAEVVRPGTSPHQQQDKPQYLQQLRQQAVTAAAVHQQPAAARPSAVASMDATQQATSAAPDRHDTAAAAAAGQPKQPATHQQQQQQQKAEDTRKERKRTASDYGEDEPARSSHTSSAVGAAAQAPQASSAAPPAASSAPAAAADAVDDEALLLPGYSVSRVVGEGGFCQVRLATHHLSRRKVAVKVIDKTKLSDHNEASRIQREIRVMKRLNHSAIIRLFEVLEAGSKLFLVMEYAPAGSLLDYVRSRKRLSEGEAAYFVQQIVAGLQFCHDNEVVHRDIKLENILLDATNNMKLIDFGLAAFYASGKKLRVHCGSPSYAAPEIVARKLYDGPPVDVWSLGVVLFAMLAGFLPFHSPTGNKQELCQKIMAGNFNAPEYLSPAAKDILSRMLTVDPDRRITLAEVAAHPWTRGSGPSWDMPSSHCYAAPAVTQDEVAADQSILAELETHGYPRATILRYLAAGDTNYVTASYYLSAEGKAEAARKLLPAKPWPFQPVAVHSRSKTSSSQRPAATATGGNRPNPSSQAASGPAYATAGTSVYAAKPAAAVVAS